MPDEIEAAWRFFLFNWIVVGALALTLAFSLLVSDFSIAPLGLLIAIGYVGIYAGFAHANARSPTRRDPQVMFVLGSTAQIALITAVMAPMTYVAAAINLPMQDSALLAVDRAMGLDWAAYVHFVDDRPSLASWLNVGYAMIGWPLFAIPVVLAAKRRYQRIEEFTFAFGVALAATTFLSALCRLSVSITRSGSIPAVSKISIRAPISISCAICRRPARACCAISSFWVLAVL